MTTVRRERSAPEAHRVILPVTSAPALAPIRDKGMPHTTLLSNAMQKLLHMEIEEDDDF